MKVLLLILFTSITALFSCVKKNMEKPSVAVSPAKNDTTKTTPIDTNSINYLALGDSYTIGEAVPELQSYPYQLVNLLGTNNYKVNTPTIIARTGWRTDQLIDAIATSGISDKKYDFVTLLIGVNDQYQNVSPESYRTKFIKALSLALSFANGNAKRVFVLSIPDYGVTPFANGNDAVIGPQIDQFNAINKQESVKAGVNYLDITPISRKAATDPGLIAPDGLHPSGPMYTQWIDLLEPMVKTQLQKN